MLKRPISSHERVKKGVGCIRRYQDFHAFPGASTVSRAGFHSGCFPMAVGGGWDLQWPGDPRSLNKRRCPDFLSSGLERRRPQPKWASV